MNEWLDGWLDENGHYEVTWHETGSPEYGPQYSSPVRNMNKDFFFQLQLALTQIKVVYEGIKQEIYWALNPTFYQYYMPN